MGQDGGLQAPGPHVVPAAQEAFLREAERLREVSPAHAEAGEMEEGGPGRLAAPDGLEEGVIGLGEPFQLLQGQAQVEISLPGPGIRIAPGLLPDRRAEAVHALIRLPVPEQVQAKRVVQPDIGGIPAKPLPVIIIRQEGRVAVLLQMLTGQIQLLQAPELLRGTERLGGLRNGLVLLHIFGVFAQDAAAFIQHRRPIVPQALHGIREGGEGTQIHDPAVDFLLAGP